MNRKTYLQVYLPVEIKEKFQELCGENHAAASSVARSLIRNYVKEKELQKAALKIKRAALLRAK